MESSASEPLLSVLILTVPRRVSNSFQILVKKLERQSERFAPGVVEIIGVYDNKTIKLGRKRNLALSMASGRYVTFIDDDDEIDDDYLLEIIRVIRSQRNPDVIHFPIDQYLHGVKERSCRYGLNLEYSDVDGRWTGKPAHTHIWKTELARSCEFPPSLNCGEDTPWCVALSSVAKTEFEIDRVLYRYMLSSKTETRTVVNL